LHHWSSLAAFLHTDLSAPFQAGSLRTNYLKAYDDWKATVSLPATLSPQNRRIILFTWAMAHIQRHTTTSLSAEQLIPQWFAHYHGMPFKKLIAVSSMHLSHHRLNHHLGHSQDLYQPVDFIHIPMTHQRATQQTSSLEETLVHEGWAAVEEPMHWHNLAQLMWWALHLTPHANRDVKLCSWFTETAEQLYLTLF
jgi:hypothetical protein